MSSLYDRLVSLKAGRPAAPSSKAAFYPPDGGGLEQFGFSRAGSWVFRRELFLTESRQPAGGLLMPGTDQALFFDTETTGLGAGNVIFLAGLARPETDGTRFVQLFLTDFPGESEFLELLIAQLGAPGHLVSYNGAAFDLPLLRARAIVNRLDPPDHTHTDLIHVARRLWKRVLGDCSLASIERSVLGVKRENDVAGAQVPDLYHRYLREGKAAGLEKVFQHNLEDVLSLQRLLTKIEALLVETDPQQVDQTGLAVLILRHDRARGLSRLTDLAGQGDLRALRLVSREFRAEGRLAEAVELWRACFERHGQLPAGIELAKHFEHRRRDFGAALELVRSMLNRPLPEEIRSALRHRRDRLVRKLKAGA